ncbi:MAG: hypothetical protein H8E98_04380 [Bacteroidetes bacterium]|nr:hypothetical protein [Bacteroidota bacterium]
MKKLVQIVFCLSGVLLSSCWDFPENTIENNNIAAHVILNANPIIDAPDYMGIVNYFMGVDIIYLTCEVIDKNDSLYIIDDSLITYIPSQITVTSDSFIFTWETENIQPQNENGYYTFPYIDVDSIHIKGGSEYLINITTFSGFEMEGSTKVPGDFQFLKWEDGKYLKKTGTNKWKIRWSSSNGSYNYWFEIDGNHPNYDENRLAHRTLGNIVDNEIEFNFIYTDQHLTGEEPGIDGELPITMFALVIAYDENYFRYKFLNQDPAGWINGLGMAGSMNATKIEFEQDLNTE